MAEDAPDRLDFLPVPPSPQAALATLSEPVRRWFTGRFTTPTPGQRLAWPAVAEGKHFLLCAPTGSGKTLAAFLPVLDRLLSHFAGAGVRCLYLAPLKALANDTRRNLRRHLRELAAQFNGQAVPVRVGLRIGDTPERVRRRLLLEPPDVLLTTPESLAVLLARREAYDLFGGLSWVIVDEVHALAESKRGADLALSLERLEEIAGLRLQRIGLSATCAPLADVARFLAGVGRPCTVAQVAEGAPLELTVEPLPGPARLPAAEEGAERRGRGFLARLVDRLLPELEANRTTLVFTNVRSLAERLAWALRNRLPEWADGIAVHHSSLAAARRRSVERALKGGRVRVAVSSASLELGVDIGSVDGVVLVHPPGGVVRLLQRVGRAGHGPGRPRRGLVLTAGSAELLEAAVTGAASHTRQYEPLRVPRGPLDVLCQQLLGMAAQRPWDAAEALGLVRRAYPFRDLDRRDFDDCLEYLCGLDAEGRPWLPARLARDGAEFRLADARTGRLLRRNLGTILAEEPRAVRLDSGPAVGQLDEAFADRLGPGDRFLLDGRCLQLKRVEAGALVVEEVAGRPAVPRWAGDPWPLSAELARRLYVLRVQAAEALLLGPEALGELLARDYGLRGAAAEALVSFFMRQEAVSEIPDVATCLVECVRLGGVVEHYVHTELNRAGNDALARVAVYRLGRDLRRTGGSFVADLGFMLWLEGGDGLGPEPLRRLLDPARFEADLAEALAASQTLRERFRRVALTGLMLLRNPLGRRRRVGGPEWGARQLFDEVRAAEPGFVLLRQALREVQEEGCDGPAARAFADSLGRRELRCRWLADMSPFAWGWTQMAPGAVEQTEDPADALRRLHSLLTDGQPAG
jgi:ATP-dependent helicase Lhr and Lhr-like helicase